MPSPAAIVGAGLDAEHACTVLVSRLAHLAADLERAAATADAEWEGPHRERFDQAVGGLRAAFGRADAALVALRSAIDDAVRRAAVELAAAPTPR